MAGEPAPREAVVVVHGLARTSRSMAPMKAALEQAGYGVYSLRYPSRKAPVEVLVREHLAPLIAKCQAGHPVKIHFVTHSMGGILLRQYLATEPPTNMGRIVMLGTPNHGSEVVDKLGHYTLFEWINGPAGQQLGTGTNALPHLLPVPATDVGIIAGTHSINPILSLMIPGPDDGKVSTGSARMEGMKDFSAVPVSHPYLMRDPAVIEMTIRFLKMGVFEGE